MARKKNGRVQRNYNNMVKKGETTKEVMEIIEGRMKRNMVEESIMIMRKTM